MSGALVESKENKTHEATSNTTADNNTAAGSTDNLAADQTEQATAQRNADLTDFPNLHAVITQSGFTQLQQAQVSAEEMDLFDGKNQRHISDQEVDVVG